MVRFMQKVTSSLQHMPVKVPKYSICKSECLPRVFFQNYLQKNRANSAVIFVRKTNLNYSRSPQKRYEPVKLAYEQFEPKGGSNDCLSPLIFLHGITSSKETTWGDLPQIVADQTKRKAYNIDARNHGDSEWSEDFDMELNCTDLLHFMEEKKIPKAVIIGHSMGGLTGIKAALRAPERIEMLFVEEMFVKKLPQELMDLALNYMNVWREAEKFIPSGLDKKQADNFITEFVIRKTRPENNSRSSQESRFDISYPLRKDSSGRYVFKANLEIIFEKMRNTDALKTENVGIFEGPSYFLYATKSAYQVGKEKHHIQNHFPNAVFIPFEGSMHFVHKAYSDQFIQTIVEYIKLNENNDRYKRNLSHL